MRYYRRYYDENMSEKINVETALDVLRENYELEDEEIRKRLDAGEIMESRTAFYYARGESFFSNLIRRLICTTQ